MLRVPIPLSKTTRQASCQVLLSSPSRGEDHYCTFTVLKKTTPSLKGAKREGAVGKPSVKH